MMHIVSLGKFPEAGRDWRWSECGAIGRTAVPSIAYSLMAEMQEENHGGELTAEQEVTARDVTGIAYAGVSHLL